MYDDLETCSRWNIPVDSTGTGLGIWYVYVAERPDKFDYVQIFIIIMEKVQLEYRQGGTPGLRVVFTLQKWSLTLALTNTAGKKQLLLIILNKSNCRDTITGRK